MVLGPVAVWRSDAELPLGPSEQRALPALPLHAGQTVGLSQIVDVLWHGDPPNSTVNVVHRHIGSLRKPLKPDSPPRPRGPCRCAAAELYAQALSLWRGEAARGVPR
ncbi:AfsR/SARP family transcriptional regulator [Streptomyces eurythermus]|uniref:AfsR/SARP family transcriptional regulator n=1 Tax=Streptomyces eurythermus TaxID=42237 RepID=UPI0033D35FE5